jgi:hypothetical protein
MTKFKTLSAIGFFCATIASPVFAQEGSVLRPTHHRRVYDLRNFRGVYNQFDGSFSAAPRTLDRLDTNGFGFDGTDRSWVGCKDPSLNPSGS